MADKQAFIREKAQQNTEDEEGQYVLWSRHAIARLVENDLVKWEVELSLVACEIIEDYPALHRPLPDCLVLGWGDDDNPIHAVIALDPPNDRIFVITVYRPDPERWTHDYKTRK